MLKHLRGKHDQRDHGRRAFGSAGGSLGGGKGPSLDSVADVVAKARETSEQNSKTTLSNSSTLTTRDRLDDVRNDIRAHRAALLTAQRSWKKAVKTGDDAARQKAEQDFAEAFGKYEGAQTVYNSALANFQAARRAENRAQAASRRLPPTPPTPPTPLSWKNLPRPDPNTMIQVGQSTKTLAQAVVDRDREAFSRERERVYDQFLDQVRGQMLPDRGQFLSDGTYIPSERAIRIARSMQEAIRKPDGALSQNQTQLYQRLGWEQGARSLPDLPEDMTPFSREEARQLAAPTILQAGKDIRKFDRRPPPKKKANSFTQGTWRDTLDRIGRFISPVDRNGNPTSVTNGAPIAFQSIQEGGSWIRPVAYTPWLSSLTDDQARQERANPLPNSIQAEASTGTIAHELIHEMEWRHPVLSERVQQFLERRQAGHTPMDTSKMSNAQMANPNMRGEGFLAQDIYADTFSNLYSGRTYMVSTRTPGQRRHAGTEVLSTLTNALGNLEALQRDKEGKPVYVYYKPSVESLNDTEHFAFFIDVMSDPSSFGPP